MTVAFPRLNPCVVLFTFVAIILNTTFAFAQNPAPSARAIQTQIETSEARVNQVINQADKYFNQGKLNLADNKREQARDDFDKAVDAILNSGMDVRSNPRLRDYYLQLVENIYRIEIPTQRNGAQNTQLAQNAQSSGATQTVQIQQEVGFRTQKFEPSPLDDLSKLQLTTEEQNVTASELANLDEAKNAIDFGFRPNPLIQQFINYYQGRGRGTMESGLRRSGRFTQMARRIFREEGVPEDIVWLAQVESAWRVKAYSSAAASGLWQFIPGTGSRFGLRQTAWIDERNSYEKATRASAKYLKWLATRYNGNWELAMGAYNTGEGNIDRAISRAGSSDFWKIYPYIAQETRNYVPNILAVILIAKNPEQFGFRNISREAPLGFDVVRVPNATSLNFIADATDSSVDYIRDLNPELRRDVTPRGESYDVRVPGGRGKQFLAILKRTPTDRREDSRVIRVAAGEDLAAVAARTGTTVAQLQTWNAGVDLSQGGKIVVPAGTVRNVVLTRARGNQPTTGREMRKVRATAGDTISRIAARNGASADEVARLNGIAADAPLQAGQEINVPSSGAQTAPRRRR